MLTRLLTLLFTLISLTATALSPNDIDNVHVADRTRFVSDMASAMSVSARMQADSILQSIWQQTSAEPVVVIVPSLEGEDIDNFATQLFSEWGIGKSDRDNGVTYVNFELKQMGLGSITSWGAEPLDEYKIKAEEMDFRFVLRPVKN